MDPNKLEKSALDSNLSVICNLLRGRESVNELLTSLSQQQFNPEDLLSAIGHAMSVLSTINDSLSILKSSQLNTACSFSSQGIMCDERASSSFGIDGSGSSKTRHKPSWTRSTPVLIDDGYAWRKYGEKQINNTTYPRSYYKCTHSSKCEALKQVQMITDNPTMYRITYTSHHSCKREFENPNYMESRTTNLNSSVLINFASENYEYHSSNMLETVPFTTNRWPVKQENEAVNTTLDGYPPSCSDFQMNEFHLHTDDRVLLTSMETAEINHGYLDGSSFMMDSMDGSNLD